MSLSETLEKDLKAIFMAGVARVDPEVMIRDQVRVEGSLLRVLTPGAEEEIDLSSISRILVVGAGKAGASMARGLEGILGNRISDGVVLVKDGHLADLSRVKIVQAGHPVPDQRSVDGSRKVLELIQTADSQTLVIGLISGGGSALLTLPFGASFDTSTGIEPLSLEELQETTHLLLASGAVIQDMNCVRKHLSDISGGRLAEAISKKGARGITFILSDVLGDSLESIASGPTAPDSSTFNDALAILQRYSLTDKVPTRVREILEAGAKSLHPDTPKPGSPVFARQSNCLIGSNAQALQAAAAKAQSLGYHPLVLSSQIYGEAREVAKMYFGIARDQEGRGLPLPTDTPVCILAGGETTVTLKGPGKGGRNQEMVAAFLAEAIKEPGTLQTTGFLSAGTDGSDGPTDAAGGIVTPALVERARSGGEGGDGAPGLGQTPILQQVLETNDSYPYLEALGALYKTGPTNTNVCDIQIILSLPHSV